MTKNFTFMIRNLFCIVLFCLQTITILAQTGPGGVGNPTGAGGQPRNSLWLRADIGVLPGTNGLGVTTWNDQSGNGNNFTQGTAGNRPVFATTVVNGRPLLRFTNTSNHFLSAAGTGLNSTSAVPFTFFAVTNSNATQTDPMGLFDSAPGSANTFRFYNDGSGGGNTPAAGVNNSVELWSNQPALGGYTLNASSPSIVTTLADFNGANRRLAAFKDGTQIRIGTGNNAGVIFSAPQFGRINSGNYFSGDIAEAIIFDGVALNTAQRLVVENHLGAKYGRDLGANDYYTSTNTNGATGFNYDVIGILGLNTGEKQSVSTSANFITLTEVSNSLTTAGAPLSTFIGHNNATIAPSTANMADIAPLTHNLGRDYWLESNGTHTYTITFDFAAAGFTCLPSPNPSDYTYIARLNTSSNYFNVTPLIGTPVLNGTKVSFTHTTTGGVAYINIGYRASTSTAPIVYSFNGNCTGGGCSWENNANWTADPTGATYIAATTCTNVARVILNGHTVNVTANGATSNSVTINAGGRLNLGTTTGHNFTTLAGEGTLSLASITFPTVTTNTHITTAGSTIEFTGTTNYNIPIPPNGATTYRNLTITGGGNSIKTITGNRNVAEKLAIEALTTLEVGANNLTVSGLTAIEGTLADGNVAGTSSLQNVFMNGGTINGGAVGIFNIAGALSFVGATNTIGQATINVTGATSLPAGVTTNFTSTSGNKTFTGAVTINGNWNNSANEEFFFGNDFTLNNSASFVAGTACNYTFQGVGNINGTMTTYILPIMRVWGTYTNNIPQLFVTGNIAIGRGAKLTNATGILPPYFIGFNNTRKICYGMNVTATSNHAGNYVQSIVDANGDRIEGFRNGAGNFYSVRTTDLQTNTTPANAQAIMLQFGLDSWGATGLANNVATIAVGSSFADDNTVPLDANTTARLSIDFTTADNLTMNAGTANSGSVNSGRYVWVINPTGAAITYRRPGSNVAETVAAGTMDVWAGNTNFANDIAITNTGVTPTDFKIVVNGGTGGLNLFDLKINPMTTPIIGAISTIYCTSLTAASAPFNVPFSLPASASTDTHFNSNNIVLVQLSDASGSFANPATIGSLVTTATSGSVTCAIPANRQGAGFRMRIMTQEFTSGRPDPGFVGADNGTNITVNGYRTSPTLPQTVAVGASGTTLSITSFSGGTPNPVPTSYQWAYRTAGSTVVNNIVGATSATYTPAPPLTSVSNTYSVFCILTSACGSSFSDAVQISVNCSVTTNLAINGDFSTLPPVAYSGTPPAGHIVPANNWGFATQYGNPTTAVEAAATVDCTGGGGSARPCSMYPETTYAVGFNPADYHTNFCNSAFPTTNVNSAIGSATITRTGTIEVQTGSLNIVRGTGTNFQADLVGSVIYIGAVPRQRSLITSVDVAAQTLTVSPAFTVAFAAGSAYSFMHGSKVIGGSGGYCLVGNGATNGSINIWQQNINVNPNRNYVLTFNAINLNGGSLAFATLFNCYQIGANIDNPGVEACKWAKYSVQWNSGSKTSVSIAIRNVGVFAGGNDITVDDIVFYECTDPVSYPPGEVFIWKGITNDWFNGDNWGTCGPPTCSDDITIPVVPVGRVYPVINGNGAAARDIQIDASASLTINANFNLDVCGNFNNQGTTVLDPTSTVTFITDTRNPQLVTGTWTGTNRFGNMIVNKTSSSAVLRFDTDVDILRSFTITRGTVNGNSRLIKVGRDFTNTANGTFNANNSTVTFNGGNATNNGSVTQIFTNAAAATACQFFNAEINQSSTSTVFLNNDLIVNNVLTLTRGKFVRSGAAGFRYVDIRNTASASIVGHNANSYVATTPFTTDRLILRRAIANTNLNYDFPVGDASNYQLAKMEITSPLFATANTIDAFFTNTLATGTLMEGVCTYSACDGGYWSITPNTATLGTARYNMELVPVGFTCGAAACTNPTTIAKGTYPSSWGFVGSTYTTGFKRTGFSNFTDFVPFGGITILPITLLKFTAKANGNRSVLDWITSSETNNKEFLVQRSSDGFNFENIATIPAAGNTTNTKEYSLVDRNPKFGINYYRLQQIDFDGKSAFSRTELVVFNKESNVNGEITVYPNPVDDQTLNIIMPFEKDEKVFITLTDMLGKTLFTDTITYNGNLHTIHTNFASGVYLLSITSATNTYHKKVIYSQK